MLLVARDRWSGAGSMPLPADRQFNKDIVPVEDEVCALACFLKYDGEGLCDLRLFFHRSSSAQNVFCGIIPECSPGIGFLVKDNGPAVSIDQGIQGVTAFFQLFAVDLHVPEEFDLSSFIGSQPPDLAVGHQLSEQLPSFFLRAAVHYPGYERLAYFVLDLQDGIIDGVIADIEGRIV